ncbi:MAG: GntR family transcriptional regulator [Hyphomicrobiaceae bacterium]
MNESTLKERVYREVRELILVGKILPGDPLRERDLSEKLDVSRTPLREALNRLEREGLAIAMPNKGFRVAEINPDMAAELLELRFMLEAHAARLAARNISAQGTRDLKKLMVKLDKMAKRKEPTTEELLEETQAGLQIHYIIARESGQAYLNEILSNMYGRLSLFIWVDVLWVDQWEITRAEHREIVDAVLSGDEDRAAKATQDHVRRATDELDRVSRALSIIQSRSGNVLDNGSSGPTSEMRRRMVGITGGK